MSDKLNIPEGLHGLSLIQKAVAFTERIDREPLYICGLYDEEE